MHSNAFLISINPPYTDMIFSGEKTLEFRKTIIKHMAPMDTAFIYETKNKKGCGKIIGFAKIGKIAKPQYLAIPDVDTSSIHSYTILYERDRVKLQAYEDWAARNNLPAYDGIDPETMDEFCRHFEKIGGAGHQYNYAIHFEEVTRFSTPYPTSVLWSKNGPIRHAPQNMVGATIDNPYADDIEAGCKVINGSGTVFEVKRIDEDGRVHLIYADGSGRETSIPYRRALLKL